MTDPWFLSSKEFDVLIKGNKAGDGVQAGTNEMALRYFYGNTNVVQSYKTVEMVHAINYLDLWFSLMPQLL
jgi:hypothetical protein